jgi:DNA-binding phage protein
MEQKTLKEFLDGTRGKAAFAKKAGISRNHLYQIATKKKKPSLGVALTIERLTNRVVSFYELLGLPTKN